MLNRTPHVKVFDPDHWAQPLEVPRGLRYVEADDVEGMIDALTAGLGVHSSSCGGHVFIWPDPAGGFHAEHFFQGPASYRHFEHIHDAVAFAGSCII